MVRRIAYELNLYFYYRLKFTIFVLISLGAENYAANLRFAELNYMGIV